MNVFENFKNLFLEVWKSGVSGINISEIIIALIHLHIIIAEALGHLILIKLGKLLLIWHKILI